MNYSRRPLWNNNDNENDNNDDHVKNINYKNKLKEVTSNGSENPDLWDLNGSKISWFQISWNSWSNCGIIK